MENEKEKKASFSDSKQITSSASPLKTDTPDCFMNFAVHFRDSTPP
jgi:hypothetical protein